MNTELQESNQEFKWISFEERVPRVRKDFETMLESQYISRPIWIKLKEGMFEEKEIDGFYVIHNGNHILSLHPCGTSQYYKLDIATHWRYKD